MPFFSQFQVGRVGNPGIEIMESISLIFPPQPMTRQHDTAPNYRGTLTRRERESYYVVMTPTYAQNIGGLCSGSPRRVVYFQQRFEIDLRVESKGMISSDEENIPMGGFFL